MTTRIVNLTPHEINILDNKGELLMSIPPEGKVARIKANTVQTVKITTDPPIPLSETVFGKPVNVPNPTHNTIFVVSRMIVAALPDRVDLLFPNEIVRNDKGHVIGCKSLSRTA